MIKISLTQNLSNSDVIKNRTSLIKQWEPQHEVWSLRYGDFIIASMAAINGTIINSIFRKQLKLRHHGWKFTMLFASLSPAITGYTSHKVFITDNVLLFGTKYTQYQELKAISLLQANALLYCLITAPTINLAIAGTIGYRIPYLSEKKELLKFWWSVVRPRARIISLLFLCNMFVAGTVTYSQKMSMKNMTDIIFKIHKYLDETRNTSKDSNLSGV